jgi:flagellar assembly factor FliW
MTAVATETETPQLTFVVGLPGFPEARTFELLHTDLAQEPFSILRCIEDEALEFVVVPPYLFFPDYAPEIDDATASRVELTDPKDALLLVILTVGEDITDITANLLGPIVVNSSNNMAAQAVLTSQGFELRTPLFSKDAVESARSQSSAAE